MNKEPGKIITFYSYKGGTGRSMVLANVAYLLAMDSRYGANKVLMIDWDLEAPGLYRYFQSDFTFQTMGPIGNSFEKCPGLTELLDEAAKIYKRRFPSGELVESQAYTPGALQTYGEVQQTVKLKDYLLRVEEVPNLFLLKAGREDSEYSNRVRAFDWENFYDNYGSFFAHFRRQLMDEYDYILIDSRTGLTDTSGICTRVMPEKLAAVFAPNRQNIEGLVNVIKRAMAHRRDSRDPRALTIFPVASRIDAEADRLRLIWWLGGKLGNEEFPGYQKIFEDLFVEIFDLDACDLTDYFGATQIPHKKDYAYGEAIAALTRAGTADPFSIATACANLTERLAKLNAPWEPLSKSAEIEAAKLEAKEALRKSKEALRKSKELTTRARRLGIVAAVAVFCAIWIIWLQPGSDGNQTHPLDEAKLASYDFSRFQAADEDYFHDMDQTKDGKLDLRAAAKQMGSEDDTFVIPDDTLIKGRNTWMVWSAGNDRLWDTLIHKSAGALDFLKILSSHPELLKIDPLFSRDHRWQYLGLVNDPCFEKATGPDPERWGLWLDRRKASCQADPFENEQKYPGVKTGSRGTKVNGSDFPVGSIYGYETGIVGLRLFPNPDFDDAAAKKWDPVKFYADPSYYNDKNLVRPYRVGMSCAFCHVGPNPIKPPDDPENPKWENLSANVGAQYFWIERIFYWEGEKDNFVWQLFHTSRPGSLDTSFVSTDNINNPRTMNALYLIRERLEEARRWGRETLTGGQQNNKQFNNFIPTDPQKRQSFLNKYYTAPDTVWTPRILKDGADSAGALGALNRAYLNIGTFSEEWLLHFNALVGGKPVSPIEISVARDKSAYFAATENQTLATALYLLAGTGPHHLKDAPGGARYLQDAPDVVKRGKEVFAERCARCHSSKRPEPPVPGLDPDGCNGKDYLSCWNQYWAWTKTDDFKKKMAKIVMAPDFIDGNYLSSELRVPVTLLQTNACSALATNALAGNIWDNFSSQSYKDLPSVGTITWYHPYTGEARTYTMPAGGRGYTRPPSLVSLWSTAPFLLNNSIGKFNYDPSVQSRLDSFQDSIEQMLWPEKRDQDEVLGNKIPGKIDRTTQSSYIKIAIAYLPDALQPIVRHFPELLDARKENLLIGPIPKGTPVGLIANLNPLSESTDPANRASHDEKFLELVVKIARDLHNLPQGATDDDARKVLSSVVEQLLDLSKCPDLIVNRGHYFGTDMFSEEPGLSDADKRALIAFLKTF